MSIEAMFKRSVIATLLTVAIILSMFSTPSRVHALNEPNLALNPSGTGFPYITASYECCGNLEDSAWNAVNGTFYYKENEPRDRWTNYDGSQTDWLAIDFGSAKTFNQVKLYIYNDGGGVQPPASYLIQYWNGSDWIDTTNSTKTPATPTATINSAATPENTLNTVNFDTVTSQNLKVTFTNQGGSYSGVVELEVYLHDSAADQNAAASVISAIQALPELIVLSDKMAVESVRSAYDNLSEIQRGLVTNLSRLTGAESAIAALQPPSDPPVSLSFSDSNSAQSTIGGNVTLVQPINRTNIAYYSLFWGDNMGAVLPDISAIANTNADASNTNVTFSISDLVIPTVLLI
jgi:hypothetical protein